VDRNFVVVIVSIVIVSASVGLSIFRLITSVECETTTPYYILLTNTASLAAGALFAFAKRKPENFNNPQQTF
jgi:hypothetical protein